MKPFKTALVCGRFQHIHVGHERVIDTALAVADTVLVLIGSSQESGTERNPFSADFRAELIKTVYSEEIYEDRIIIGKLPDMTTEDDIRPEWGLWVLKHAREHLLNDPEVMVYGNDENREGWFDPKDIQYISRLIVSRATIPISATQMREYLVKNNFWGWGIFANTKLRPKFHEIRTELLKVPYYAERWEEFIATRQTSI